MRWGINIDMKMGRDEMAALMIDRSYFRRRLVQ